MYPIKPSAAGSVIMLGGSGFVGSVIAAELARRNIRTVIPSRRPDQSALRVLPDVHLVECNIHDDHQLHALLAENPHAIVINLVGVLHDREAKPYGDNFARAHVALPRRLIAAMQQFGLHRLLHMSALGADPQGASMYQRSKGDGEQLVRASGLDWTVFRPSVIFGRHDSFINLFAAMQRWMPIVPLAGSGVQFQPVFVNDVAQAFVKSLDMPQTYRQAYDLAGPDVFTLADLVRFAGQIGGHPRMVLPLPPAIAWLQATMMEYMPGPTLLSRDNLRSMYTDNILPSGQASALSTVFGMTPASLQPAIYR